MVYASPRPDPFPSLALAPVAVHDIQHQLQPHFPEVSRFGEWERREYVVRNCVKNADVILVDSEVGRDDIVRVYGLPAKNIQILPYVPMLDAPEDVQEEGPLFVQKKYKLPPEFAFYPAQFWPHKNHYRIVESIVRIRNEHGLTIPIVFVGSKQTRWNEFKRVMQLVKHEGLQNEVRYLDYLPSCEMPLMYRAAKLLLMPTFFGPTNIPVLEAFALGCPVITSNLSGIREQVGDAALLVDPMSSNDIAEKLYRLWTTSELRNALVAKGLNPYASWREGDFDENVRSIIEESFPVEHNKDMN